MGEVGGSYSKFWANALAQSFLVHTPSKIQSKLNTLKEEAHLEE